MSSNRDRNQRQRAFGFIGFSAMAHIGLLAVLALVPQSRQMLTTFGAPNGGESSDTAFMDLNPPGSSDIAASQGEGTSPSAEAPREVLLAAADDRQAIALPVKATNEALPTITLPPPTKAVRRAKAMRAKTAAGETPAAVRTESELPPKVEAVAEPVPMAEPVHTEETIKPVRIVEPAPAEPLLDEKPTALPSSDELAAAGENEASAAPFVAPPSLPEESAGSANTAQPTVESNIVPHIQEAKPAQAESPQTAADPVMAARPAQTTSTAINSNANSTTGTMPGHPLAAQRAGVPPQIGAVQPNGQPGQAGYGTRPGRGTGFGVPLGVQIRDAGELIAKPGNPQPAYTEEDRLARREGVNVLVGRVNPDGTMGDVFLEKGSGSPNMDRDALKAFRQWKFMPGQQGYIRQPFKFQLTGEAKVIQGRLRQ